MTRVWINKSTVFDTIIAITNDAVITADLKDTELQAAKQRIEDGESPLNVFGDKATLIPYFKIKKIKIEDSDEDFEIEYAGKKESDSKTVVAVDIDTRKDMVAEIQSHLGDEFTSMTEKYNLPRAAFGSLMTLTILIIVTWMLHGAAAEIADGAEADFSGRNSGIKKIFYWALDLLGETGVLIIGGLLMLLAVLTLIRRIKEPMIVTTIKKGKQSPGAPLSTAIKYAVLIGVWYLFAPGIVSSLTS